jgi:hypothetical protein
MPESACKMPVKMLANTQTQCENAHHYVSKSMQECLKMPAKCQEKCLYIHPQNSYKYVSKKHVRMLKNAHDIGIVS